MKNWQRLNETEYNRVWEFVFNILQFKPNVKNATINLPNPYKCYDISGFYGNGFSEKIYDNFHKCAMQWFKRISNDERIYALNWQHTCYSFSSKFPFEKDEFDEWLIPIFPNGDYLFFLTNDFKNGIFADGINLRFLTWGVEILDVMEVVKPDILIASNYCI